jgi:serine/threonine protein kinase
MRCIPEHVNIVNLYEVFETQNSLYLVIDLVKGGELLDMVFSY